MRCFVDDKNRYSCSDFHFKYLKSSPEIRCEAVPRVRILFEALLGVRMVYYERSYDTLSIQLRNIYVFTIHVAVTHFLMCHRAVMHFEMCNKKLSIQNCAKAVAHLPTNKYV